MVVEPVWDERQRPGVGGNVACPGVALEPVGPRRLVPPQEARATADAAADYCRWNEAHAFDRNHGDGGACGDPLGLPARDKRRLVLDDDRRRRRAEALDEALLARTIAVDMLDASEPALAASAAEIAAGTEDEAVQPVRGVGVVLAHSVIDEDRPMQRVAKADRRADHRFSCPRSACCSQHRI